MVDENTAGPEGTSSRAGSHGEGKAHGMLGGGPGVPALGRGRGRGRAAGYMPELNVLCRIADYRTQGEQPLTKHLVAEITSSHQAGPG